MNQDQVEAICISLENINSQLEKIVDQLEKISKMPVCVRAKPAYLGLQT